MKPGILFVTICVVTLGIWTSKAKAQIVPGVILDQDMSSDHDDVGDLSILNALAITGRVKLLACVCDSQNGGTPTCMNAINTYWGNSTVPVGIPPNLGRPGTYAAQISTEYPHPLYQTAAQCPDGVALYRQILASQPNNSVVIISSGYLNEIDALLQSGSDQYSPLDGSDLIAQKVLLFACAGGQFPSGGEFDFTVLPAPAEDVVNNWPAAATYDGFELASPMATATDIAATPRASPMRRVWELFTFSFPWGPYPSMGQFAGMISYPGARGLSLFPRRPG